MSALVEALERIRKLHLKHQPLVAEELQPGLTRGQIDELVKNLPFSLPEELYELYQWRNGMKDLIQWQPFICNRSGMYGFLSLEKALETSQREYEATLAGYGDCLPNWLLIFEAVADNCAEGCVVVVEKETAVIRTYDSEYCDYPISHTSLTNMLLADICNNYSEPEDMDFSGADLSHADFRNIRIRSRVKFNQDTNLESADFRGSDLTRANLGAANLRNVKLKGAFYSYQTIFPEGTDLSELVYIGPGANLAGLDLQEIYFSDFNLAGANLSGALLTENYMDNANLENANLTGADLDRVNLEGANLSGANFKDANLRFVELKNAIFNNTIMPDGSMKNGIGDGKEYFVGLREYRYK
ncbi:MAG: hypothetical protein F6K39_22175 [Okeania sp. SIO3B3]|nr:hypothetical protein [Okeania sp. SIO3B3]